MKKSLYLTLFIALVLFMGLFAYFLSNYDIQKKDQKLTNQSQIDTLSNDEKYISPINILRLRELNIDSEEPILVEELSPGSNYNKYIASYYSEGYKIYGLLTIPQDEAPEGGFPAIVFNHGYINPASYVTTQKYEAYVDNLAKNGFVVFKIDLRGHGNSEGTPSGSYFSPAYTLDAISALKSLQKMSNVNPDRIGMWGHSMAGNLVLRSMLVSDEIKAGVIWAGAVYSYEDFGKYGLNDSSYVRRTPPANRENSEYVQKLRSSPEELDFTDDFWKSISLTENLDLLSSPIQVHHSEDDTVVDIGYSLDLKDAMLQKNKDFELFEYAGGGHNINSPYFEQAMQRTVQFFKDNL